VLLATLEGRLHPNVGLINPVFDNRSPRSVRAWIRVQLWVDLEEVFQSRVYNGEDPLALGPYERVQGVIRLTEEYMKPHQATSGALLPGWAEVRAVLSVAWEDDLGERGFIGPKWWYGDVRAPVLTPVVDGEPGPALRGVHRAHPAAQCRDDRG